MLTLPVFYFPSTIAWIDDDALFLNAVSQIFRSNHPIETFNHPQQCLHFFQKYAPPLSTMPFLSANIDHEHYDTANHAPVDFNVPALHQIHNNLERNKEISVIVVDYRMPEINGIELCQQLNNLPCKKILLTGEADQFDAITAFNNNIIDRFIRKDSPTLVADIQTYVATLSYQYFCERTRPLLSHLEVNHPLALSDPIFIDFFKHWCSAHSIREYSLIDKYGSLLVINQKNQRFYFVLHTDRTLASFASLHDDNNKAEPFITQIKKREKIPFFGVGKESWEFELTDWPSHFYSPKVLQGREKYYWTVCELS